MGGGRLSSLSNEKTALGAKKEHLQVTVTSSSGRGVHARVNFYGACENQVRISEVSKEPLYQINFDIFIAAQLAS
jgi:hypothetical protein